MPLDVDIDYSPSMKGELAILCVELLDLVEQLPYCLRKPVPEGMSLPIMTFSFKPISLSSWPSRAALIRTLDVSWKEAAERKLSVVKETLEIPSKTGRT